MLLICSDHNVLGILEEVEAAQVAHVFVIDSAQGDSCPQVGHGLVFGQQGFVAVILIGLEVIQVQQRSLSPVAVESQVRHAHVDIGAGSSLQSDEAFHIHAVLEGIVHVLLVGIAQSDLNSNISFVEVELEVRLQ